MLSLSIAFFLISDFIVSVKAWNVKRLAFLARVLTRRWRESGMPYKKIR
jgi:hypothetical protein